MYADQVEVGTKTTVKDRISGGGGGGGGGFIETRHTNNNKRQRPTDSKWEHDLYKDHEERPSKNFKLGAKDLRLHLQRKDTNKVSQIRKSPFGGRDLRDMLSGIVHAQLTPTNPPKPRLKTKPKPVQEVAKPARNSVRVEVPQPEVQKAVNPTLSRKKSQQKSDRVDALLQSLDLEKYLISFQAEEIDMMALMQMSDEDLKALGIPMGPRKKILLALDTKR